MALSPLGVCSSPKTEIVSSFQNPIALLFAAMFMEFIQYIFTWSLIFICAFQYPQKLATLNTFVEEGDIYRHTKWKRKPSGNIMKCFFLKIYNYYFECIYEDMLSAKCLVSLNGRHSINICSRHQVLFIMLISCFHYFSTINLKSTKIKINNLDKIDNLF